MMDVNYTSEKMLQGKMCLLDISVAGKNESIFEQFYPTLLLSNFAGHALLSSAYCIVRYMSRKTLFRGAGKESFAEFIPPLSGL